MQKWHKQGLAALLLIIVLAGSLLASEPENELRQIPAEVPETKEGRPAHQAVEGSERAASSKELTNPFTMLHETRAERENAARAAAAEKRASSQTVPAAPIQPSVKVPEVKAAIPAEPVLRGLMSGAGGQLALIDWGGKSLMLGVGEEAEGIKVEAIENKRALVSTRQGEIWLDMP